MDEQTLIYFYFCKSNEVVNDSRIITQFFFLWENKKKK